MAKKWNLIVDVERCDNCRLCFLAVKDEYVGNDFPGVSAAQPSEGQHKWLDIEVIFDPEMKVSQVKCQVDALKKNIADRFDGIADVVIISRALEPELKEI